MKLGLSHHPPENKRQSVQWRHTHSPTVKEIQNRKIKATIFWDRKGPLLVNFLPHSTACSTLNMYRPGLVQQAS
jgi:hypothetical protein